VTNAYDYINISPNGGGQKASQCFAQIAFGNFFCPQNFRRKFMPYQYKKEPLNNDEIDKLINSCDTPREKFVIWLLVTALTLS
jgi:hypothetical protein